MRIAAVCLAAGQGKRMESNVQKQYLLIHDKPVLYYALKAFQDSPVDEVVLVVGAGEEEYCQKEIVDKYEDLMTKRSRLWNQHKKSKSRNEKESIHLQIEEINKELNPLRKEVGLCDDIEKRIPTIRKNLDEFYSENERKEVSKDEHIR